jgi:hypothetical protein
MDKRDFDKDVGGGVDRDKLPAADFVDPINRKFPIVSPKDVHDAAVLSGHFKGTSEQFHSRLSAIAHRKGTEFVNNLPKAAMAKVEGDPFRMADYKIMQKAVDGKDRFTLGIAYPVNETDTHGEFAQPRTVELAAWWFAQFGSEAGYMHISDQSGNKVGQVVETYIYRNPTPWIVNGQSVEEGDWVVGVVWMPDFWELIVSGQVTGYSVDGTALRVPVANAPHLMTGFGIVP